MQGPKYKIQGNYIFRKKIRFIQNSVDNWVADPEVYSAESIHYIVTLENCVFAQYEFFGMQRYFNEIHIFHGFFTLTFCNEAKLSKS